MQAPEVGLLAPDLVVYLDIPPEVVFLLTKPFSDSVGFFSFSPNVNMIL